MKIKVDRSVLEKLGQDSKIYFAVVEGLKYDSKLAVSLASEFKEFQADLRKKHEQDNYLASPVFAAWDEAFSALGLDESGVEVSLANMLERIVKQKKDLVSVHPLVDFYNMFVLREQIPMGAYDLDRLNGDVSLLLSDGKEKFLQLGKKDFVHPEVGEVILRDDDEVMCRYWVWKQSETTKIRISTKNVLLRFEVQGIDQKVAQEAIENFLKDLKARFNVKNTKLHVLSLEHPEAEVELNDGLLKARENFLQVKELLSRGVSDVIDRELTEAQLLDGHKFRIKHGVDPTTKDLHLGYAVIYEKLRCFQQLGHTIIFLIGSFTGRFGDPSDKNETRSMRSKQDVETLAQNYLKQLGKILDLDRVEVRYNGDWYDKMSAEDLLKIMSEFSVAQMLERDMFEKRMEEGKRIGLHEIVYPVLQGYDSVELESDLTVIGTDQTFNELQARPLQARRGQKEQNLIAMRLLVGLDGKQKMSQSLGNYIGFDDEPNDMYGKVMSLPDNMILEYFEMVTRVSREKLKEIKGELLRGENPRNLKMQLAREIVGMYHGDKHVKPAEEHFVQVFQKRENPDEIALMQIKEGKMNIVDLLVEASLVASKSEARRLIEQGGVKLDDVVVVDFELNVDLSEEKLLKVGKRKFLRVCS